MVGLGMQERDLEQEAFERGRRGAFVDAAIDSHEKRLNAINGSIDRHARETLKLRGSVEDLRDQFKEFTGAVAARAAVEADRAKQLERANDQQISNRTFWLGVITIVVMIVAAFIASGAVK